MKLNFLNASLFSETEFVQPSVSDALNSVRTLKAYILLNNLGDKGFKENLTDMEKAIEKEFVKVKTKQLSISGFLKN